MTSLSTWAQQLLMGPTLQDKLITPPQDLIFDDLNFALPRSPGRIEKLKFSDEQFKFPKKNQLNDPTKLSMALHSFANHELLAIEMMAAALLIYPHHTPELVKFKRGVIQALKDEQKHFSMYVARLRELGHDFGDFPLNDFFWRQMESLKTPEQYLAVMALTFESANLDFAYDFSIVFKSLGDHKSAAIMEVVLEDEISHVALGSTFLDKWKTKDNLWDYYCELLPWPLTPARSKGKSYSAFHHLKAMLPQEFVEKQQSYQDEFRVTKRKEWKNGE